MQVLAKLFIPSLSYIFFLLLIYIDPLSKNFSVTIERNDSHDIGTDNEFRKLTQSSQENKAATTSDQVEEKYPDQSETSGDNEKFYDNLGFDSTEQSEKLSSPNESGLEEIEPYQSTKISLSPIIETATEGFVSIPNETKESNIQKEAKKPSESTQSNISESMSCDKIFKKVSQDTYDPSNQESKITDKTLEDKLEDNSCNDEKMIQKNSSEETSSSIYNTALETNSLSSEKNGRQSSIFSNQFDGSNVSSPRSSMYESALTNLSQAESDSTTPFRSINSSFDSSTLYHSVNSQEFSVHSSTSLTSDAADNSETIDVAEDITITDDPGPKVLDQQDHQCKGPKVNVEKISITKDNQAISGDHEESQLRRTSLISDISSEGGVTDHLTDEEDDDDNDELTELLEKKTYTSARSNANILDTSDESPKETDPFLWDKPCSPFEIICMDDLDGYDEFVHQQELNITGVAGLHNENEETELFEDNMIKGLAVIKEESFEVDDSDEISSVRYVELSKSGPITFSKQPSVEFNKCPALPLELKVGEKRTVPNKDLSKVEIHTTGDAAVHVHAQPNDLHESKDVSNSLAPQTMSPPGALQPSELFSQELMQLSDSSAITTEDLLEELQGIHCGQVDPMVSSSHTLYDIETPSDETPEPSYLVSNRMIVSSQKSKPGECASARENNDSLILSNESSEISFKPANELKITRPKSGTKSEHLDHDQLADFITPTSCKNKKQSFEQELSDERPFLSNQGSVEPELQRLIDNEGDCDSNKLAEHHPVTMTYPRPHSDSSADLHLDAELRASSRPESVPCNTYNNVSLLVLAGQENESMDRPISPLPDDAFRIPSDNSLPENTGNEKNVEKIDVRNKNIGKVLCTETMSKDLKDEINFGTMKTNLTAPIQIPKNENVHDFDDIGSVSSRGSLAEFERIESAIDFAENSGHMKDSLFVEEERLQKTSNSSLVIGSLSSLQEFERLEKEIISGSLTSLESKYEKICTDSEKTSVPEEHRDIQSSDSSSNTNESTVKPNNLQESLLPLKYKDKIQAVPEMSPISEPDVSMEQDSLSSPDTEKRKPLELVEEEEDTSIDCQITDPKPEAELNLDVQRNNLKNFMISSKLKQNNTMMISADSLQEENRMTDSVDSLSASIHEAMTGSIDSLEGNNPVKEGIDLHEINVNDAMVTSADSLDGHAIQMQNIMMADSLDGTMAAQILKIEKQDSMIQSADSLELNETGNMEKVEDEIEIDSLQGSYIDQKSNNHPASLQGSLSDSKCFDSLQESFTADKKHVSVHNSFSEKITKDSLEGSIIEKMVVRADFSADSLMSSNKNQTTDPDSLGDIDMSHEHSEKENRSKGKTDTKLCDLQNLELDNGSIAGLGENPKLSNGKAKDVCILKLY